MFRSFPCIEKADVRLETLAQVIPLLHVTDVDASPLQVRPGMVLRPAQEDPVHVIMIEAFPSLQAWNDPVRDDIV